MQEFSGKIIKIFSRKSGKPLFRLNIVFNPPIMKKEDCP
jgi:hypothetical protein